MDINLSNNQLENVNNGTFHGLNNLKSIDLTDNHCQFNPPECDGSWQTGDHHLQFCECH